MSGPAQSAWRSRHGFDLRAYLAGSAVTVALSAGVILVFGSLAAYVAFEGNPIGGGNAGASEVVVESSARAPKLAAAALSGAPRFVAREPAAPTAVAPAPAPQPETAGGSGADAGAPAPQVGVPAQPAPVAPVSDGGAPTAGSPVGGAPASAPSGSSTASGPLGNTVNHVDNATGLGLGETTAPVTGPVDTLLNDVNETVQGLGNTVGGALGGVLNP